MEIIDILKRNFDFKESGRKIKTKMNAPILLSKPIFEVQIRLWILKCMNI